MIVNICYAVKTQVLCFSIGISHVSDVLVYYLMMHVKWRSSHFYNTNFTD